MKLRPFTYEPNVLSQLKSYELHLYNPSIRKYIFLLTIAMHCLVQSKNSNGNLWIFCQLCQLLKQDSFSFNCVIQYYKFSWIISYREIFPERLRNALNRGINPELERRTSKELSEAVPQTDILGRLLASTYGWRQLRYRRESWPDW